MIGWWLHYCGTWHGPYADYETASTIDPYDSLPMTPRFVTHGESPDVDWVGWASVQEHYLNRAKLTISTCHEVTFCQRGRAAKLGYRYTLTPKGHRQTNKVVANERR